LKQNEQELYDVWQEKERTKKLPKAAKNKYEKAKTKLE
jgi:hypothetical protein